MASTSPASIDPERSSARGAPTRFRLRDAEGEVAPIIDDRFVRRPRVNIAPGRLIPGTRYRTIRWLGEGGMGVVYEAEHIDVGRRVAVKILRPSYSEDPDALELFRQEARATAQIGAEGILQVFDFAQLPDGRLMMAMELLEGHDLMSEMGAHFDPARVIAIGRQCCQALAEAHDVGLVHRDIKPENIFLTATRHREDKVKLVDFGISVVLSGDKTKRRLVGTPQYIAPEAISSSEIAPALDQYALGVVLYEMLTATSAFEAPTVAEMIQAQLTEMPYPPSQVAPGVPAAFDDVIMRCLAKDPAQRFANIRELEAALCETQIAAGLRTPWDDLPLPDVDAERREWLAANMPSMRPPGQKSSSRLWVFAAVMLALLLGAGATAAALMLRNDGAAQAASIVDEKAAAARAAGAKALWVYPPNDAPKTTTAYQIVRDLEDLAGDESDRATEVAALLRGEFAAALSGLGDQFWTIEGGEALAIRYYDQALLFSPELQPARDRASMTKDEIAAFEQRAEQLIFAEEELENAETLRAAAEPDSEKRAEQIAAVISKEEERTKRKRRNLLALRDAAPALLRPGAGDASPSGKGDTPGAPEVTLSDPKDPFADEDEDEDEGDGGGGQGGSSRAGGPEPLAREKRDPKAAKSLARNGMSAYKSGNYERATLLFEQALAKNPREMTALIGLRDLYFDRGDYGRSTRYGRRVVAGAPKNASHRLRLGDAYYKVARFGQAEKEYTQALELGDRRAKERLDRTRNLLGK